MILLWALFFARSVRCNAEFYLHVWGMEYYNFESVNNYKSNCIGHEIFLGIKIPTYNKWKMYLKKQASNFIMLIGFLVTISVNLVIFYLEELSDNLGNDSTLKTLLDSSYGNYVFPLIFYLARKLLSNLQDHFKNLAMKCEDYSTYSAEQREGAKKDIVFEFFNYYFSLYYIAFFKQYYGLCQDNSCFDELGNQLFTLIFCDIVNDMISLIWLLIFKKDKEKSLRVSYMSNYQKSASETENKDENLKNQFACSKIEYYIRKEYKCNNLFDEYKEILLIFGYVVQFGSSSPMCFIFAFAHAYISRFGDAIKMIRLQYVKFFDGTKGLGIVFNILKIYTMIGFISNVLILFFTHGSNMNLDITHKFTWVLVIQNLVLFLNFFLAIDTNPDWLNYKEKIEFNYNYEFTKK